MEIGVEGEVYAVTLWWEILPEIRKKKGMAETAVGDREGRKNHARGGVWEKIWALYPRNSAGDGSSSSGLGCDPEGQKWDYGQITQGGPINKKDEWAAMGKEGGPAEGKASDGLELLSHGPAIKQQALQCSVAERAIMDEALRYGSVSNLRVVESSSSSSTFFGRTPERESCDHSGEIRAGLQKESKMEPQP
ncbi:hypothetical protein CK203_086938 [Vitis vinifera]|uniref:Uncharacterized protein n=1 Tax=Vitis vinifera TaxID=29760 RepID=A0A438FJ03_VITVI|nr:hypothetical protein CK203_086938 [Vitis vinifera]